jgi:hypothetical protein
MVASVPLVLTFVKMLAATRYECQNRDTTIEIHLPDSKEKKGLQLALKPLNGPSIAGYVLKP